MHRGYFKVWRKQEDSRFWSMGANARAFWITCLHKANHKEAWFLGHPIECGSFACSSDSLAKELKISRQQIRTLFDTFTSFNMLVIQNVANRFTKITICNWEIYNGSQPTEQPTDNQPITNQQPTDNHNQRMKEVKNQQPISKSRHQRVPQTIALSSEILAWPEMPELWAAFQETRKKLRKPLTQKAAELISRRLTAWGPLKSSVALKRSIENAWQGVFEPRPEDMPQTGSTWNPAITPEGERRRAEQSHARDAQADKTRAETAETAAAIHGREKDFAAWLTGKNEALALAYASGGYQLGGATAAFARQWLQENHQ